MAGSLALVVFGLVWMAGTTLIGWQMGSGTYRQYQAKDFAQTSGLILESKVEERRSSKGGRTYVPAIQYEYEAGGKRLQSSKVRFGMAVSSEHAASTEVARFPQGKKVTVFYDPADPSVSVLETSLRGSDFFGLLFLTPFACIGLGCIVGGVSAARRSLRKNEAGGARIMSGAGGRIQVRLPEMNPSAYAFMTIGVLSFLSIFIMGFATRLNPNANGLLLVWLGCIAAGLVVYFREASRLQMGFYDLVIDVGSAMVSLPRIYGLKTPKAVGFRDVREIRVKEVVSRGKGKRTNRSYDVVMRLVDGSEHKLAHHSQQPPAASLAVWLREKLGMAVG